MSSGEALFGAGRGRSDSDAVTGTLLAMSEAWLAAIAPIGSMSRRSAAYGNPGMPFPGSFLLEPMMGMLAAIADLAAANRERFDAPVVAAHSTMGVQENSIAADFVLPMGHAMIIAANRSVSYWLSLAQIFESHQARLAQLVGGQAIEGSVAGSERLAAADELRALLREVGDLATREARIMQNELSTLYERLAQTFQQPDLSGSYRRRWRIKA
jgi:hypothetical protein